MLRNLSRLFIVGVVVALSLAGCASGPTFSTIQSTLPALAAEKGRVYFYRESSPVGAAIQPSIMMDGKAVGDSVPGGVFFVDAAPGNHEVATSTEVERKLTFTLGAGQVRYVRTNISFGIIAGRVQPELVDSKVGAGEIAGLSYTGSLPK